MGTGRVVAVASDQGASLSADGYSVGRLLISEDDLQTRIRALGEEITAEMPVEVFFIDLGSGRKLHQFRPVREKSDG